MQNSKQAYNSGATNNVGEIEANNQESNCPTTSQEQNENIAANSQNYSYVYQQGYSNIPVQLINHQPIYYAANVSYVSDVNPVYFENPNNVHTQFMNEQPDPAYMPVMNFSYPYFPNKGTYNNYYPKDNRDGVFHNPKWQWSGDNIHIHKSKYNTMNNHYKREKGTSNFNPKGFNSDVNDLTNASHDEPVELLITNLDYNIPSREWKKIISTQLQNALNINQPVFIQTRLDGSLCATVKINCLSEARLAISHFHRKKIGFKRIHVNIINPHNNSQSFQGLRQEVVALLQSVYNNSLSVSKFIELFARRFHRTITISDLYKLRDIVEIKDDSNGGQNGSGRVIQLLNTNNDSHVSKESVAKVGMVESSICHLHCSESLTEQIQSILPNVIISLGTLKQQVHHMLMTHDGSLPLFSFLKCYEAEFGEFTIVKNNKCESSDITINSSSDMGLDLNSSVSQCSTCSSGNSSGIDCNCDCPDNTSKQSDNNSGNGVPLEHLLTCIPGVQIVTTMSGIKKLSWEVNADKNGVGCGDNSSSQWTNSLPSTSTNKMPNDILSDRLHQFSREVVELLKHQSNCRLLLSKFIPTYHHYFGKQCRVADYGYAKLNELMDSIKHVVHVMGTGTVRYLTLSHKVQVRRFTNELVKVLKSQTTKSCKLSEFPSIFEKIIKREFKITEYGICFIEDMLKEIPENTVELVTTLVSHSYQSDNTNEPQMCSDETFLCIPKRMQTAEEKEKTLYFAQEVFHLLKQSSRIRLPFNKFIPSYHHHFSKQCKVSDYGFSKLFELLEAISHITKIFEENEEKYVTLTRRESLRVFAEQILSLLETSPKKCMTLKELAELFIIQYGFPVCAEDYGVKTLHQLISKVPRIARLQIRKLINNADNSTTVSNSSLEEASNFEAFHEVCEDDITVCLNDRSGIKNLAHKLLLLLLEIPEGALSGAQFIEKYRSMFREDPDLQLIESQLFEIIYIIRDNVDYNNFCIRLKPLVMLSRDLRDVLRIYQGKILLSHLDSAYIWLFGVELRPQNYGFSSLSSLIQAVPFVATLIGRGVRTTVCLSNDFIGKLSYKAAYSFEPVMDAEDMETEAKEHENSGNSAYCISDQAPVYTIINCIGQNNATPCNIPMTSLMNADFNQESENSTFINNNPPFAYPMTYSNNRNPPYYANQIHPDQKHLDQLVEQLAFDRTSPNGMQFQNGSMSNSSSICTIPSPGTCFPNCHFQNPQTPQYLASNSNPIAMPNACCFSSDVGSTLWQPNFATYCPQPPPQQFFTYDTHCNSMLPMFNQNIINQEDVTQNCEYKVNENNFYSHETGDADTINTNHDESINNSTEQCEETHLAKSNEQNEAEFNYHYFSDTVNLEDSRQKSDEKDKSECSNSENNSLNNQSFND